MATDLAAARDDVQVFSRLVGQPLTDWQAEPLRLERRTTVIVAPRQSGKSRSLAVLALWWAFRRRDQLVLIVSAGEEAARRLLADAARVAAMSPLLSASVVDELAGVLRLTNGSAVRSVPASERQVRGWSVDLLLVDECAVVDDALLLEAAIPTTAARPAARIVLAGSPGTSEGAFYRFAESGFIGSEHVRSYRWALVAAEWISETSVALAREQLAPAQFAREYEGLFADVGGDERVVDREWIREAVERRLRVRGGQVFGLDVARSGGDESVLVRVQQGQERQVVDESALVSERQVAARVEWAVRGLDLMALAGRVKGSVGADPVFVDAIGLGWGVVDRLREQRVNAVPFVASARAVDPRRHLNARAEAWWVARESFRRGLVDLVDDRVLAEQVGAVRYRLASSGAIQIQSKDEMRVSPDRADALVLALWGARQSGSVEALLRSFSGLRPDRLLTAETGAANPVATEPLWRGAENGLTVFDGSASGHSVAEDLRALRDEPEREELLEVDW